MPALRPRHLRRYRQIAEVFTRHGFGAIVAQLGLGQKLNLPRRFFVQKPPTEHEATPAQHIRLAMEELGPTFIKIGQLLSTRSDLLPPNYVNEFSRLQDDVPPAPWPTIKTVVVRELESNIEDVFSSFLKNPIAAASLGQVHAATLTNGDEVVIKVQRPDIETIINLDLDIIMDLAQLAQERTPLGSRYELTELADEFAYALRSELDYRREGRNADRFRANFENEPQLYVPRIYWEYTTNRIMIQERIKGIKVDNSQALDEAGYDRHQLALYSARLILKAVLEDGFFHADPHPGNVIVMPNEVICLLDFGSVGRLATKDRLNLVRLYITAIQLDTEGVLEQLLRMGIADYNMDLNILQRDLHRLLVRYYGVSLKEVSAREVIEAVEPVIYRHKLHIPSDLWLLIKTFVIMEGVGQHLDPDFDIFEFSKPYIKEFMQRIWMPSEWGSAALRSMVTLGDLLMDLPRQTTRILGQVERGDLGLQVRVVDLEQSTKRLNNIANRLIVSLLLAALILGLAMLIPVIDLTWPWALLTWIIMVTFTITCILAIWLIWSILRSTLRSQ